MLPATFARAEPGEDDAGDKPTRIVGLAAVYDTPYYLGSEEWGYVETIAPGAIEYDDDVLSCYNHDTNLPLGRQSNGTLKLTDGPSGLSLDVEPNPNTSYGKDVMALVERRDVQGMSITFSYWGEYGDYEYTEKSDGWDELRITRLTLFEAGPVLNPAYKETTAEARSVSRLVRGLRERQQIGAWLERQRALRAQEYQADLAAWLEGAA